MIKCVIIDDEEPAINVLKNYINRISSLQLVGSSSNPIAGVEMVNQVKPDVVFMDIQMDEMSGIEAISLLNPAVQVIFCTAYSEFAVESYNLNAVDYLMKPISFDRFVKAIKRIKQTGSSPVQEEIKDDYIFVKSEQKTKMIRVNFSEIEYIEARSNYIAIHTDSKRHLIYSSMKDIEERLSSSRFIRIHKSFIVAIEKITLIEGNYLVLKNSKSQLPISKTYKQAFIDKVYNKSSAK
jgi:two-component system, LytTR family, response regulator